MIWHLPTCLALHNTNVHSARAMLAFCPASKTFSLFPALENPPPPSYPSDFLLVIFRFQFQYYFFKETSSDSPGLFYPSPMFAFIDPCTFPS